MGMRILKRDKTSQAFMPNKILNRIKTQSTGLKVDADSLFLEVIPLISDNITTTEIDEIIAFKAADKIIQHPDYSLLGGRILLSRQSKLIGKELQPVDLTYDFFAATTFLSKYSMRDDNKAPIELPSCMYERVANHLHDDDDNANKELLKELTTKRANFATPTYTNAGVDKRNGMISCFTKDTLINTSNGCKEISNIVVGDEVITHKNRYRKVLNVFKNELQGRTVKSLKIYRTKEIKVTDNHEFLTFNTEDARLLLPPSFKPLKHIRVGDFIKGVKNDSEKIDKLLIDLVDYKDMFLSDYSLYKATKNTKISDITFDYDEEYIYVTPYFTKSNNSIQKMRYETKLKRFILIDEHLCKFIGLYYGDGHLQVSKGGIQGIGITSKQNNNELEDFIKLISLEYFGIESKIYNQTHRDKKWTKIMLHSKVLGVFFNKFFGRHFDGKFLNPIFFKLSKKCIDGLLSGLISSDGVVTKKGELRIQIANKELLESIQQLSREFGYTVGISKSFSRNKQQYRLDFGTSYVLLNNIIKKYDDDRIIKNKNREQSSRVGVKLISGEYFYRVEDIKTISITDEYVYDLNVEEDNSYSVECVVAHNCNLTHLEEDSFEGIEATLTKIASASKEGSGIGLLIDPLRSKESLVHSFQGNAGGVVRLADMVQSKMRFYKQGSRSGSCALYLSVWHKDIFDFLDLTLPIGDEQLRTRDLFTAVVINDLFMKKLENNEDWFLFCPNDIKKHGLRPLYTLWGEEFESEYQKAVELGIGKKVNPKEIFDAIIKAQVESGRPYVMFKDNANKRNMQSNIGPICQSNLCIEVFQASKPRYTPQCTLASINLAEHNGLKSIDKTTRVLVRGLNKVIDKNKWSDDWSQSAGLDQRALAIGVAGLADFFAKKKISFESEEAKKWNNDIFETMYKAAVEESMNIAEEKGQNYPSWEGSLYSVGETYIEGWSPKPDGEPIPMYNSLLLGLMPTASSAILLGSFESFEPVTANLFTRRVGQGEFLIVNKYLVNELIENELWDSEMIDKVIKNKGSIQNIVEIPEDIRFRYKDVWEIPQRVLLDLAIIRNKYVDQSQSLNVYHVDAKYGKIASALMYAWKGGLKTGVYYTRTKSKLEANSKLATQQINVIKKPKDSQFECFGCSA